MIRTVRPAWVTYEILFQNKQKTKPNQKATAKKGVTMCKEAFGGWNHGYGSYLDCSDDVIDVCISQNISIVCYKYVRFIMYQFNLSESAYLKE